MTKSESGAIRCRLCPKCCRILPGQSGECRVRMNVEGELHSVTYGRPCSVHVDPIEKKPLFHFLPGTRILSIATVGCNLHCRNCQNWEISQANPEDLPSYDLPPDQLAPLAVREHCPAVAYTYTEPLVYYEYTRDCCQAARAAGLRNVLVTAAYVNREPLAQLAPLVDAANVDIKALSDSFYREVCDATLQPVLTAIETLHAANVHLEITNLVIPTLNDTDALLTDLIRWVKDNLGVETPLHFSRFFPQHRMTHLPPTPTATLERARNLARAEGLHHVYIGNVASDDGDVTRCAGCQAVLIRRNHFAVTENRLRNGACPDCVRPLAGVWQ